MYSFLLCIIALLLGYFFYGRFVDKVFGADSSRPTPANYRRDGVDYVPMPAWKVYMIQFLNIAGTGPIFGAIMGAKFGPSSFLWIVFGSIFAGGVHDYFSGMFSVRGSGTSLPDLVGYNLGNWSKKIVSVLSLLLLLLVGTVFVYSPAVILKDLAGDGTTASMMLWVGIIFAYYILATLIPIDKLIGRIYPIFAFVLIFMAVSLMVCLFVKWPSIPELWQGLENRAPSVGVNDQSIFPYLFITIACGALSGFHSTQSPLMAKCLTDEKLGRPVFYGAMITEGIVALIWAAVASYFFFDGGAAETGCDISAAAPVVVTKVSKAWLGVLGSVLAILGVVAAPVTSGDTALRSARITLADILHIDQRPITKRVMLAIPIFVAVSMFLWFNMSNENGFNTIWRYFGWANQTLAAIFLWAAAAYLWRKKKGRAAHLIAMIPAEVMTVVSVCYICIDKTGFRLDMSTGVIAGVAVSVMLAVLFYWRIKPVRA